MSDPAQEMVSALVSVEKRLTTAADLGDSLRIAKPMPDSSTPRQKRPSQEIRARDAGTALPTHGR